MKYTFHFTFGPVSNSLITKNFTVFKFKWLKIIEDKLNYNEFSYIIKQDNTSKIKDKLYDSFLEYEVKHPSDWYNKTIYYKNAFGYYKTPNKDIRIFKYPSVLVQKYPQYFEKYKNKIKKYISKESFENLSKPLNSDINNMSFEIQKMMSNKERRKLVSKIKTIIKYTRKHSNNIDANLIGDNFREINKLWKELKIKGKIKHRIQNGQTKYYLKYI